MTSSYYPRTAAIVSELKELGYNGNLSLELIGEYLDEMIHQGEEINLIDEYDRQSLKEWSLRSAKARLGQPTPDSDFIFDVASPDLIPELANRKLRNFVIDMIRNILVDLATYSKYSKE